MPNGAGIKCDRQHLEPAVSGRWPETLTSLIYSGRRLSKEDKWRTVGDTAAHLIDIHKTGLRCFTAHRRSSSTPPPFVIPAVGFTYLVQILLLYIVLTIQCDR